MSQLVADGGGRFGEQRKLIVSGLRAKDQGKLAEAGMGSSRDTLLIGGRPLRTGNWENK